MAKGAASEQTMGTMHTNVVTRLNNEISNPESDPRYVQMAIKMLSDNKIFMNPTISNELGELDKHLQKRKKRRFGVDNIADFATKQALAMND